MVFVKISRPRARGGEGERWDFCSVSPTLNVFDNGDVRLATLVSRKMKRKIVSVKSFAQNTRNEVRFIGENGEGEVSGALAAEPGAKQTTYLLIRKGK